MNIPEEVTREITALRDEMDRLLKGNWGTGNNKPNVAESKALMLKADDITHAAAKVYNAVKLNTQKAYE